MVSHKYYLTEMLFVTSLGKKKMFKMLKGFQNKKNQYLFSLTNVRAKLYLDVVI